MPSFPQDSSNSCPGDGTQGSLMWSTMTSREGWRTAGHRPHLQFYWNTVTCSSMHQLWCLAVTELSSSNRHRKACKAQTTCRGALYRSSLPSCPGPRICTPPTLGLVWIWACNCCLSQTSFWCLGLHRAKVCHLLSPLLPTMGRRASEVELRCVGRVSRQEPSSANAWACPV